MCNMIKLAASERDVLLMLTGAWQWYIIHVKIVSGVTNTSYNLCLVTNLVSPKKQQPKTTKHGISHADAIIIF